MVRIPKQFKVEPVQKRVLSKAEAMAYLGVSEDYLEKLRYEAEVKFAQRGRMIWYFKDSLDRFIDRNTIKGINV